VVLRERVEHVGRGPSRREVVALQSLREVVERGGEGATRVPDVGPRSGGGPVGEVPGDRQGSFMMFDLLAYRD
jgi:hypothetical protein